MINSGIPKFPYHLSSEDTVQWTTRVDVTDGSLRGVAYGNGSFVAVGSAGAILESGPVFSVAGESTPDGFEITLTGEMGLQYTIQATTNLVSGIWENWCTITNADEVTVLKDYTTTNYSARYYRAITPSP